MRAEDLFPPAAVRRVDDLAELAARINAEHAAGEHATRKGLEHFHACGLALLGAKERCGHGGWLPWLKNNCPGVGERKARRYMELAKSDAASDLEAEWRRICGHGTPAAPVAPAAAPTAAELRQALWVRQWAECGVKPAATTTQEMRDRYEEALGVLPADLRPADDDGWNRALYRLLAEKAAGHLIRTGHQLPCPGDLDPWRRDGRSTEKNRIKCWEWSVMREAGGFLDWCAKAGIRKMWKKKYLVGFRLPGKPFPGAKEALRRHLNWPDERPFPDEEAARILGVDTADLPSALHDYTIGHFHTFFDLKMLDDDELAALGEASSA
jgi:hypothetical protein